MKRNLIAACVAASAMFVMSPSFAQTGGSGASGSTGGQTYSQNQDDNGRHWGWLGLLGLLGLTGMFRKNNDDSRRMGNRAV